MPETNVNFDHLIQDIVQAYPYSVDEAVLVELIANALDAKCTTISISVNAGTGAFELMDDGRGMNEVEFTQYHDVAVSFKARGKGIGFAGLGAKLGVWQAGEVITEARSSRYHAASRWYTRGRRLPYWEFVSNRTLTHTGTKVAFKPPSGSPLLDPTSVQRIVVTNYAPLLDPYLSTIYREAGVYPQGISFLVNGTIIGHEPVVADASLVSRKECVLRKGKRKSPIGLGYFLLSRDKLPDYLQGIAVCAYGKMIKREWFRKYPRDHERITGFVEVPMLVETLTTTKTDFLRTGAEGQRYHQFYREMQGVLGEWLTELGQLQEQAEVTRETAKLERVLRDILSQIPELATFFATKTRREVYQPSSDGEEAKVSAGVQEVGGTYAEESGGTLVSPGSEEGEGLLPEPEGPVKAAPTQRSLKFGPKVAFAKADEDRGLGWIDTDTIYINTGHPAFPKAESAGQGFYHQLISIAYALLDHRNGEEGFDPVDILKRFFGAWGRV